ncbi:MAG: hypothetical protein SGJ18_08905 [Pseudomonadota bacterium]|nr:hypothetical protein [Pseudomonadota bacterium]
MSKSKSVGILLLLVFGLTVAFNSSAATSVPTIKKTSKIVPLKKSLNKLTNKSTKKPTVKTAKKSDVRRASIKVAKTNSISNSENILTTRAATQGSVSEKAKKWTFGTHVDYRPETSKAFNSGIGYGLDYFYRPSSYHTFRIFKGADQIILPSETPERFVVGNTKLFYYYKFTSPDTKDHAVAMRFLVTVGDSQQARTDGLNSVQSARLEFNKMIGGFTLGLNPYVSYYWADYATNAKNEPLPLFGLGHTLLLAYSFTDKWSIGTDVTTGFSFLQPEEIRKAKVLAEAQGQDASAVVDTTKSSFNAGVELGYKATKAFSMRLGYAQEDALVSEGKYGVEFLDKKSTRGYVGFDYSF